MALHFGWTVEQWKTLPWWQQRMYREGLGYDGKLDDVTGGSEVSLDDLASAGMRVRRI